MDADPTPLNLDALLTRDSTHPSELALDEWQAGELSVERAQEIDAHCAGCAECTAYLSEIKEGLSGVARMDPDTLFEQIWSASQAPQPQPEAKPTFWDRVRRLFDARSLALVGLGAAAAVAFFVLRPAPVDPTDPPFEPRIRMKGDFALELARKTAQGVQPMVSGDTFDPDDSVRFLATIPADGRARVLGIEGDGTVFTAWPLPAHSASDQVKAGKAQALPGAVQLDGKPGKEVLHLVWCPPDIAPICAAAGDALACPKTCRVAPFIVNKTR